jgi:hypothetical protein
MTTNIRRQPDDMPAVILAAAVCLGSVRPSFDAPESVAEVDCTYDSGSQHSKITPGAITSRKLKLEVTMTFTLYATKKLSRRLREGLRVQSLLTLAPASGDLYGEFAVMNCKYAVQQMGVWAAWRRASANIAPWPRPRSGEFEADATNN